MVDDHLTELERRNLELVDEWAATWNQPGGSSDKLVNELYADEPEVRAPLQPGMFVKVGDGKAGLLAVEQAAADAMRERTMVFRRKLARGNSVAVEVEVPYTMTDGRQGTDWFAAFLTFDADGRIVEDHTFMRDRPFTPHRR